MGRPLRWVSLAHSSYGLFYTAKRVGGGVQDFDAIKLLKFAAA
jgi:predicted phage gp36 major capsid-like protein